MEPSTLTIPIDKEFKFKKIDLEILKDSTDGFLDSKTYRACTISNVNYYLRIFPNGNEQRCRGRAGIFLRLWGSNALSVVSEITLTVESENFKRQLLIGKGPSFGSTAYFFGTKFFVDGVMTVQVKGILKIVLPAKLVYPIAAEWKIKESELERMKTENKEYLHSKCFTTSSNSEVSYYLTFWPNENKENKNNAGIYLNLNLGSISKIEAYIRFTIDSVSYSKHFKCAYEKSDEWGLPICSTEELFNPDNRYFADGEMIINVTGNLFIEKESVVPTVLSCEKGIASKAYQKHRGKEFTIVVGEKNIKVHKKVLIESSSVFEGMFRSGMIEVTEKKMELTDFEPDIVEAALKLLYSDSIPINFTFDQMLSLLQFTDKYDIKLIMNLVQDYLTEKLSPSNVCYLINFTSTTTASATKLHSKCVEYFIKCSRESKAVHNLDTLDKDFAYQILLKTLTQSL